MKVDSEHLPPRFRCPEHEPGSVVTPQDALPGSIIFRLRERNDMGKIMVSLGLTSLLVLTACNTVRGVGRDVQSVGRTVEKTTN